LRDHKEKKLHKPVENHTSVIDLQASRNSLLFSSVVVLGLEGQVLGLVLEGQVVVNNTAVYA